MSVDAFLTAIEGSLKSGIATEHTYRPALQSLFETVLSPAKATNEPKHAQYGAPDFVIQQGNTPLGHVEAKDIGLKLGQFITDSERDKPRYREGIQLKRYRAALPNLLFTDGLEWHWFVNGEARLDAPLRVGTWDEGKKKLALSATAEADLASLLKQFAAQKMPTVNTPRELADRLAQAARWLHDVIIDVLKAQGAKGDLHQQLKAFRQTLLPTLKEDEFADMYAQTIVYGLFAARVAVPEKQDFSRLDAAMAIPKTNPFLRKLFQEIAGYDLDERIAWLVDDCASLLARTDIGAVLKDFGKATKQEDPVVHFYETFLASYNPALRESRGVYYTPEPVVSYIVRSVDSLLKTHFNKPTGLADENTVILDPATGTATFLHAVVQRIYETVSDMGLAGAWDSYVSEKLLPRLFGFELLMAPYTIAHLKLGLLLGQLGYQFDSNERLGIYLTNALEGAPSLQMTLPFAQYIAQEGQAANVVKHDMPVMIVLGNPPYSGHSSNQGQWIVDLLKGKLADGSNTASYYEVDGQPLGERNSKWLQDDYVKFFRFAQWRINNTGEGVLVYISNNGYLDNPTFRGMRQSLIREFDVIYILNLHGNSKKKENSPDGSPDVNVFDIQQGVAIGFFVKKKGLVKRAEVYYADLWGERQGKYLFLASADLASTTWQRLKPESAKYLFIPRNISLAVEYEGLSELTSIMPFNGIGMNTHRDGFVIEFERNSLEKRIELFCDLTFTDEEVAQMLGLQSSADFNLSIARRELRSSDKWRNQIIPCLYRPFDIRFLLFDERVIDRPRPELNRQMLHPNISLATTRQTREPFAVYATDRVCGQHKIVATYDGSSIFPLYVYPDPNKPNMFDVAEASNPWGRRSNISPEFVNLVENRLGLSFIGDGKGDLQETFGPEDVFHYIYAVLSSQAYKYRYSEFLQVDFPRIPITSRPEAFSGLIAKGAELVDLHLLRLPGSNGVGGNGGAPILVAPGQQGISFPRSGTSVVDKIVYVAPRGNEPGRVAINSTQYFEGIEPETWEMRIGGYQPLDKWLKDRKGRMLNSTEVVHYMRMVIALRETQRIMAEIDALIPSWPLV